MVIYPAEVLALSFPWGHSSTVYIALQRGMYQMNKIQCWCSKCNLVEDRFYKLSLNGNYLHPVEWTQIVLGKKHIGKVE